MSVESVVKTISSVTLGPKGHHDPSFGELESDYVTRCLKANGQGDFWRLNLEKKIGNYCQVPFVVPTNSGTAALHVGLAAAGVKPNEEVLVPSLTFVGTANAVCYVGAIPHFIDCLLVLSGYTLRKYLEKNTKPTEDGRGRLNPTTNRVISAVIAVDLLGFPAELNELEEVAEDFGLCLIEDAAQAFGSSIGDRKCGSFGKAAILSFNSNKIVTGHGGGALLTKDESIAARARALSNTARTDHPWRIEHVELAFNYRMSSLTAALICAQIDRIDSFLEAKKIILEKYVNALVHENDVSVLRYANSIYKPNYWLATILSNSRSELLNSLHKKGIKARALFTPLHSLPAFDGFPHEEDMCGTKFCYKNYVCLPSGVSIAWQ